MYFLAEMILCIFSILIGLCHQVLVSFSIIRNIKTIMNTDCGKRDLTYLHGIRVLSLFWIILFHSTFIFELGSAPISKCIINVLLPDTNNPYFNV